MKILQHLKRDLPGSLRDFRVEAQDHIDIRSGFVETLRDASDAPMFINGFTNKGNNLIVSCRSLTRNDSNFSKHHQNYCIEK